MRLSSLNVNKMFYSGHLSWPLVGGYHGALDMYFFNSYTLIYSFP